MFVRSSVSWHAIAGLIAFVAFLGFACAADDDDIDDNSPNGDDDDNNDASDMPDVDRRHAALPEGDVPYVQVGGLPVPTHRTADDTDVMSLDGTWLFATDPDDVGQNAQWFDESYDRGAWVEIAVPGSFSTEIPELLDYKGVGWYARSFDVPAGVSDAEMESMFLRFGAIFLRSQVYVNGTEVVFHHGGYTPVFAPAIGLLQRTGNVVVVRADNRITWGSIPVDTYFHPGSHGWWPFGGITRPVSLHTLPVNWLFKIEPRFVSAAGGVELTLGVRHGGFGGGTVVEFELAGPDGVTTSGTRRLTLPYAGVHMFRFKLATDAPRVWSREAPDNLYVLTVRDAGGDEASVRFGYRDLRVDGNRIMLNGRRDFWRGINRHSDHAASGPVESAQTVARDVERMRQLHVNHTRPGHYPVDERLLDALLEAGITIIEETPVYQLQFGQMQDEHLLAVAAQQMAEVIERDKNNPAILAWSLGNENGSYWPTSGVLTSHMNAQAKRFDPWRPTIVVVANETCEVPINFTLEHVDIMGVNQYYGWYMGKVSPGAGQCMDTIHRLFPDKPIVATEFGAGALAGRHLPEGQEPGRESLTDHSYSEEFQAWFLEQQMNQLLARDYLSGTMPWVLADFRMEWNPTTGNPHPVVGMNLKGLLTHDRETEKLSFGLISDIYGELAEDGR